MITSQKNLKIIYFLGILFLMLVLTCTSVIAITCSGDWYSGWSYRKNLTLNSSLIRGEFLNFTILINISDSNLSTYASENGTDILFTNCDGTSKLNHEIDYYNKTGKLVAWVQIPNVTNTTNQVIYMYYGNNTLQDQSNKTATWNKDYKGVYHLGSCSSYGCLNANDSTINKNNGIMQGGVTNTSGAINVAALFNGTNGFINAGPGIATAGITQMTQSAWIRNNAVAAQKGIVGFSNATSAQYLFLQTRVNSSDGLLVVAGSGTSYGEIMTTTINQWLYVVLVYNGSQSTNATRLKMYVNGVQQTLTFAAGNVPSSMTSGLGNLSIGDAGTLGRFWNGTIDEVHILNTSLPANWIETEYNSQSKPLSFITIGTQEPIPIPVISSITVYRINNSFATINWTTSQSTNGTIKYGTTPSLTTGTISNTSLSYNHTVDLSGLSEYTLYYYNITSCGTLGTCNNSGIFNFTTSDTTNPSISYQGNTIANNSNIRVPHFVVNVSSSDSGSGISYTAIYLYNSQKSLINTVYTTYYNFTKLDAGVYYFNATAVDSSGNSNWTDVRTVTVLINVSKIEFYNAASMLFYGNSQLLYYSE